jgi:hypothetical protein
MSSELVKECTGCGTRYDYRLRQCPACGAAGYSARREAAVAGGVRRPSGEQMREIRAKEKSRAAEASDYRMMAVGGTIGLLASLVFIGLVLGGGGEPPNPFWVSTPLFGIALGAVAAKAVSRVIRWASRKRSDTGEG